MIVNVLVRIMYALFFGDWNLRRATAPRDQQLGGSGTRISRFTATRTGLAGRCRTPSHMNW
ncbi:MULTISPECIES: hypothetical protein [unclassified Streptomyces]|uniref:hypothetical protein n=1 Tax=unclassified Streptomyces TaxID=2593676 RepID=UPI00278C1F4F|nr:MULTISPECIES: hypothetical protein [unclassified Streptomyces]